MVITKLIYSQVIYVQLKKWFQSSSRAKQHIQIPKKCSLLESRCQKVVVIIWDWSRKDNEINSTWGLKIWTRILEVTPYTLCEGKWLLFNRGRVIDRKFNPSYAHLIMQNMCQYLHLWYSKWKLIPNYDTNKTEWIIIAPQTSVGNVRRTFVPLKSWDGFLENHLTS